MLLPKTKQQIKEEQDIQSQKNISFKLAEMIDNLNSEYSILKTTHLQNHNQVMIELAKEKKNKINEIIELDNKILYKKNIYNNIYTLENFILTNKLKTIEFISKEVENKLSLITNLTNEVNEKYSKNILIENDLKSKQKKIEEDFKEIEIIKDQLKIDKYNLLEKEKIFNITYDFNNSNNEKTKEYLSEKEKELNKNILLLENRERLLNEKEKDLINREEILYNKTTQLQNIQKYIKNYEKIR